MLGRQQQGRQGYGRTRLRVGADPGRGRHGDDGLDPGFSLKLERLLVSLDDLIPRAMRDGPYTLLEEWLVRINLLHDLIAVGTAESQREVLAIARLMRFASDWQREHPRGSLADFVAYLEKKEAGRVKLDGAYVQFLPNHGQLAYNMKRFPDAFKA